MVMMPRILSIKSHEMRIHNPIYVHAESQQNKTHCETGRSCHTLSTIPHSTGILHTPPVHTHIVLIRSCSPTYHPHYTLWHSFHSSSYIFIYSTSLEAVIYDFNTSTQTIRHPGVEGDSQQQQQVDKVLGVVALCLQASQPHSPCPPVSGWW